MQYSGHWLSSIETSACFKFYHHIVLFFLLRIIILLCSILPLSWTEKLVLYLCFFFSTWLNPNHFTIIFAFSLTLMQLPQQHFWLKIVLIEPFLWDKHLTVCAVKVSLWSFSSRLEVSLVVRPKITSVIKFYFWPSANVSLWIKIAHALTSFCHIYWFTLIFILWTTIYLFVCCIFSGKTYQC